MQGFLSGRLQRYERPSLRMTWVANRLDGPRNVLAPTGDACEGGTRQRRIHRLRKGHRLASLRTEGRTYRRENSSARCSSGGRGQQRSQDLVPLAVGFSLRCSSPEPRRHLAMASSSMSETLGRLCAIRERVSRPHRAALRPVQAASAACNGGGKMARRNLWMRMQVRFFFMGCILWSGNNYTRYSQAMSKHHTRD